MSEIMASLSHFLEETSNIINEYQSFCKVQSMTTAIKEPEIYPTFKTTTFEITKDLKTTKNLDHQTPKKLDKHKNHSVNIQKNSSKPLIYSHDNVLYNEDNGKIIKLYGFFSKQYSLDNIVEKINEYYPNVPKHNIKRKLLSLNKHGLIYISN